MDRTHQVMNAMRKRLDSIEPNIKAYLFGSRARGDARDSDDVDKTSDWDVLILLDKPRITLKDYSKYSYPLTELGWDINEMINPVLFSVNEWNENHFTLFHHNVEADAIAI